MKVILLLRRDGGKLHSTGDVNFPISGSTSDRIQEVHMTILHIMIEGMERMMFPSNYQDAKFITGADLTILDRLSTSTADPKGGRHATLARVTKGRPVRPD